MVFSTLFTPRPGNTLDSWELWANQSLENWIGIITSYRTNKMLSRRAVTMLRSPVARVAQVQVRGIRASFDKAEEPMVSMVW